MWIEPVRDWNIIALRHNWEIVVCVNWTCEGLKHVSCSRCFNNQIHVWIEPVRDWNLFIFAHILNSSIGVNWTCEGLKHYKNLEFQSFRLCVNWTCEGLKHVIEFWFPPNFDGCELNLWGIETLHKADHNKKMFSGVNWTCEGLKHKFPFDGPSFESKCELNLWGIETYAPDIQVNND